MSGRRGPHDPPQSSRVLAVVMLLAVAVGLFVASTSYSRALGDPGHASVPDKTSVWARDHHLGPVVEIVENWLYSRHPPSRSAADTQLFDGTPVRVPTIESISLPVLPISVHVAIHDHSAISKRFRPTVDT